MTAADWSYESNDTIAAEYLLIQYLLILSEELLGRRYNKAAQNRS